MTGVLVLAGSGEFTPAMDDVDRELLSSLRAHARVAIVPTAAGLEDTPSEWIAKGTEHFRALGAEPVAVPVLNKADAHAARWRDAIADVDWIYFSGGNPGHLVESLQGSPFWSAVTDRHRAGAILAGSSAGAMMLGESTFVPLERGPDGLPTKAIVRPALGMVKGVIVAPHFDILPEGMLRTWSDLVPAGQRLLGIDEDTALLRRDGRWDVLGRGRVLVFRSLDDRVVYAHRAVVDAHVLGALP
ncbi:MAG TPA: Type 1 glutamine amidotransferase-like domain-containing protein [Candidatus Limnocylindria bacterium]